MTFLVKWGISGIAFCTTCMPYSGLWAREGSYELSRGRRRPCILPPLTCSSPVLMPECGPIHRYIEVAVSETCSSPHHAQLDTMSFEHTDAAAPNN
jgi:hypothetical protein